MKRKAFTLIELLVVISIIALLLSILLPSLRRAKEAGKRVVCLSNQKQLSLSWSLYAEDNNGRFCSPNVGNEDSTWINWEGPGWPKIAPVWTPEHWELSIKNGVLWPYTQSEGMYRCPTGNIDEQITYTGFGSLGTASGTSFSPSYFGEFLLKMSQLPRPSSRAVFIDEGRLTPDFYAVYYDEEKWWESPPTRHNEGATLSFADAHAEYWKWEDSRTIEMSRIDNELDWQASKWYRKPCLDNADLFRVRRAAWGKLPKNR